MATEKESVSGLMSQHHEVSRFENLFYKNVQTAYYNLEWGLDWAFWLDPTFELPLNSFVSYLTQESIQQGIVVDEILADIKDFTLNLRVTVEGLPYTAQRKVS